MYKLIVWKRRKTKILIKRKRLALNSNDENVGATYAIRIGQAIVLNCHLEIYLGKDQTYVCFKQPYEYIVN